MEPATLIAAGISLLWLLCAMFATCICRAAARGDDAGARQERILSRGAKR